MAIWFDFLEEQGLFKPENNPGPSIVEGRVQIPFWESLNYLEKLSLQISEGKQLEYIDKILAIIANVSEHPKDNHRTWYMFIRILCNLPNASIPESVFQYVETWFTSKYETMLQTSEVTEHLIPKFLNDSPTPADRQKAELIVKQLFKLAPLPSDQKDDYDGGFRSVTHLYLLRSALVDKGLIGMIVQFTSNEVILSAVLSLRTVLLDSPRGLRVPHALAGDDTVSANVENGNLLIHSQPSGASETRTTTILDYEQLSDSLLLTAIRTSLSEYPEREKDAFTASIFEKLWDDLTTLIFSESVAKLERKAQSGNNLKYVLALIVREMFAQKAKHDPSSAARLFETVLNDRKYRSSFISRLVLHAIAVNWTSDLRNFFVGHLEKSGFDWFDDYKYESDLLFLLKRNALELSDQEITVLNQAIKQREEKQKDQDDLYWKWRFYRALKENPRYNQLFNDLSKQLKVSSEVESNDDDRSIAMPVSFESPLTSEEFQTLPHSQIVQKVIEFKVEDRWNGPSEEGFARALAKAIEEQPSRFANDIQAYLPIGTNYTYFVLDGFREAWKAKRSFDWSPVLQFCLQYISSNRFLNLASDTKNSSGWNNEQRQVVGAVSMLITEGTVADEHAFDASLISVAKQIVVSIVTKLNDEDDFAASNIGYVMKAFNTTAGKALKALLDLSLRNSRLKSTTEGYWDEDLKTLFSQSIERNIPDAYTLLGLYSQQLFYLDYLWVTGQFKAFYELEESLWMGFMDGLLFVDPPYNLETYQLSTPHYKRAIHLHITGSEHPGSGTARHLGVFYLREYEGLTGDNVLTQFIEVSNAKEVENLILFVRQQEKYINDLQVGERRKYQVLVLKLWKYILQIFKEDAPTEESRHVISDLNYLIGYIEELDENNIEVLISTAKFADVNHNTLHVIEHLNELKGKGDPLVTAAYLGRVLNALTLTEYLHTYELLLLSLIDFLFQHSQLESANKVCNKLAIQGYEFQKEIFNKYNRG
jgi:hypothetical protein